VDKTRNPATGESSEFLGRQDPLLLRVVAEPGADSGQYLVEGLVGGEVVQADHEDMPETALVRGVRGAEGGVGGGVGTLGQDRQRLARQRLGEIGGGQVVRRLVGRGEQCAQVGVGPVLGQAPGPARAAQAAEQRLLDGVGRCRVERLQAGRGPGGTLLLGQGDLAGQAGETVRRQRGSSAMGR
jgi:hypothetical protein